MIDIHSHVVPPDTPYGIDSDARWPTTVSRDNLVSVIVAGRVFRRTTSLVWEVDRRAELLEASGIPLQVLSPMPELFSYWGEVKDSSVFCRRTNEWIADVVAQAPDRYRGLGIVPLQDVDAACEMLSAVKGLGLCGVEIGSMIGLRSAADCHYLGFYEEAVRLGLCIFVHAFHSTLERFVDPGLMANAVTFPVESSFVAMAFVANGIASALPTLRIAFSHGGGGVGVQSVRLQHLWETREELRERLAEAPLKAFRRFLYDSLVFDAMAATTMIHAFGSGCMSVGTDFPFFELDDTLSVVRDQPLCRLEASGVLDDNARRFLAI